MTVTVIAGASVAASSTIVGLSTMPDPTGPVLWAAALLGALLALWKGLHLGDAVRSLRTLASLSNLTQSFLVDWNGEPARLGVPARPGFPNRIQALETLPAIVTDLAATVEKIAKHTHELKGRDGQLVVLVEELTRTAAENGRSIAALDEKVDRVDSKVDIVDGKVAAQAERTTSHAERNAQTARELAVAVAQTARELDEKLQRRARELAASLNERNVVVDTRLDALQDGLRAELKQTEAALQQTAAMRAVLTELGFPTDPPLPE